MSNYQAPVATSDALKLLMQAGSTAPLALPQLAPFILTALDTLDARELPALLVQAQAVAERGDASWGRAPTADVLLLLGERILRVRGEVEGPRGEE